MILLEQNIELKIFHHNKLRDYDVLELLKDDEGMIFKIFYEGDYIFTMIPTMDERLSFELSEFDKDQHTAIDWNLYSKIEVSLYSLFLKGPLS